MSINEMGKRIAELRVAAKLTQRELGEKLTVSEKTVSKWECAAGCPDLPMIPILADVLGTTTDHLFGREDKTDPDDHLRTVIEAAIDARINDIAKAVTDRVTVAVEVAIEDAIQDAIQGVAPFPANDFGTLVMNREKTESVACVGAKIMEFPPNPGFRLIGKCVSGDTALLSIYPTKEEASADLQRIAEAVAKKQRYLEL